MKEVLKWASIYMLTMLIGYLLKRKGVFQEKDKKVFTGLISYVTLPAMIISGFTGVTPSFWYIIAMFLSIGINITMLVMSQVASWKRSKETQAMYLINGSGYNFGIIAIPYLSNFFPMAMPYLYMFDIGDSFISLGTSYALGQVKIGQNAENPLKAVLHSLARSLPFIAYIGMLILAICKIELPGYLQEFTGFLGKANGFLAMILIGISFELKMKKESIRDVITIICTRYAVGIVAALLIFFVLPAPLEMRQILATAVFAGVPNVALIYTIKLGVETDVAASLAPISTVLSIVTLSAAMLIFTSI